MSLNHKLYCHTLGCKMGFTVKGILRMLEEQFQHEKVNLTLEQYFLLNILENEGEMIIQELASILDRDKSAITRHINGLEENGFVSRTPDPEDRRRKILLVTKPGIQVLAKAKHLEAQINDHITHHIPEKKLTEFEDILNSIFERTTKELS